MKILALAAVLAAGVALADVAPGGIRESGNVTISTAVSADRLDLNVFLRTRNPETSSFRVVVVALDQDGKTVTIRRSVDRFSDSVPGTFWTVLPVRFSNRIETVRSISVEELKSVNSVTIN